MHLRQSFVFLFCVATLSLPVHAQFSFQDITLPEALAVSATEKKPVFFMAYQATCGHCEKMLNEVMPDSAVYTFYNQNFVILKSDMLVDPDAQKTMKRFSIQSFPTFVILNPSGEVLYQYVGEFKAADFIDVGKLALDPQHQLPYLKKEFTDHPGDSVACYNYLLALSRGRLATQPVANTYFSVIKDDFAFTAYNWKIFSMSVSDMDSEIFRFMSEHRKEFSEVATQKKVERKLYLTAAYNLQTTASANDTTGYNKAKLLASHIGLRNVDSMIFVTGLNLSEKNKQWSHYIRNAVSGGEQFAWNDATLLRRMSEAIYEHSDDRSQLQKAANFAVRSAELKPDYFSNLSAAKVYLKLGNKEFAKKYAEKAKELGLKSNLNITEANTVIEQCG